MHQDLSLRNLFRPLEILIFVIFPLSGHALNGDGPPPLLLVAVSLLLGGAVILDNVLEGFLLDPADAEDGDYPLPSLDIHIGMVRNIRTALYWGALITVITSSRPSLPWLCLFYLFTRLYNDRRVTAKARPPLGLLCHLGGALSAYMVGAVWNGFPALLVSLPGLGLASLVAGGYVNHLRLDAERDRRAGLTTLAHRVGPSTRWMMALSFVVAGDLLLFFAFHSAGRAEAHVFLGIAILLVAGSPLARNPRLFRVWYRLLHGAVLILLILLQVPGFSL